MKLGLRSGSLSLALLLGIAGMGCGDDDGMTDVDSGMDAGRDSAMPDTGTPDDVGPPPDTGVDSGPPPVPVAYVRVAHLSPDTSPFAGVRVCLNLMLGETMLGEPVGPLPTDRAIPFRGISPYLPFDLNEGITYRVNVFAVDAEGEVDCAAEPALTVDVDTADLVGDGHYTAAAIGYSTEQSNCQPGFMTPCMEAQDARIEIFEDDSDLDAAASKIRVLHAIPNAPPVDVCYDADPEDETPPDPIASNIAFGSASDYFESDAAITTGVISVHVHVTGMSCVDSVATTLAQLPIPTAFQATAMAFPEEVRPNIPTTFELNRITTVFAEGIAPMPPSMTNPTGVLFVPWQDQPAVAPAE